MASCSSSPAASSTATTAAPPAPPRPPGAPPPPAETSAAPLAGPLDVPFMPAAASQIFVFDHFAVLAGHADNGGGFPGLVDLATMTLIGAPHTETGLKTAALMELNGQKLVLAGYPSNVVDGTIA